jgi:hypothetical protein
LPRIFATIAALEAEVAELRKLAKSAEVIIANADGHPDMCCGQCSSAIAKAEAEVAKLKGQLANTRRYYSAATYPADAWGQEGGSRG